MLIRAWCCVQSGPSPRAKRCSVWPKWSIMIDILSQNAASRTQFFQVQAIKTGHISIRCRQTGDILSVPSKGTATAKWQMKILCEGWLLCIASAVQGLLTLQITAAKISYCILPEYEKLKSNKFKSTLLKLFTRFEPVEVVLVVGPNPEIPFCAQPCSADTISESQAAES